MKRMTRTVIGGGVALLLAFYAAPQAFAAPSSETGDAGRLPATAQQPLGSGALDSSPAP